MKNEIVDVIVDWIECHIEEGLNIEAVAAKSGYSKWHLQRAFKAQKGITLATFIRGRRLEQAAQSLVNSTKSIMAISTELGFSSQQCFQRVFKKHFHITPRDYRIRHRQYH
ncbi:helix-turn-helix domain-containing protein [Erwinia tasmaniensis]|uniref:Transcriptional regulator n=1 Tax=Erwinia tasmaniensis (strain DSM 17950 / CFBP 7177 / CIP 109463 / NCPPB 4357 / Et1/99) TaxID=465817 RepID=B2VHH7_ERWT9|nr:helix-turn-helix domain-containing protein [Erwinia tasmaniensis]CAO98397.1 Putative transcriptional regulator [Erwinia tasmaniensis Et1/99]